MADDALEEPIVVGNRCEVRRGRLATNLSANVFGYGVNIVVGILFVPYLIRHLGVSAYGLIPLATQVTAYLTIITMVMNISVGRYLTVALEVSKTEDANRVFNTSLVGAAGLALLSVPLAVWLALHADKILRVPPGLELQAKLLFALTVGTFLVNETMSPFLVSTLCRNRFDIRNAIDVTGILVRVCVVVLAFNIFVPAIWHMGAGILAGSLFAAAGGTIAWRKLTPELHISPRMFDWATFRRMTSTGGWMAINHMGALLYVGIDLIVVNRLLGPTAGGQYATVLQWSTLLRGAAGVVTSVFYPTIIYHYANNETRLLIAYVRRSVKMVGLMLTLPIGIICGMSKSILTAWVGPDFAHLWPLMSLLTIHLSINLAIYPLFYMQLAMNRVRTPAIVTCVMGVGNILLALLLAGPVGWGMYGVAAAGAVMLTAKNLIFTPLYGAHILNVKWWTFYRETIPSILGTLLLSAASWYVSRLFHPAGFIQLAACAGLLALCYAPAVYRFLLTDEERGTLAGLLQRGSRAV